MSKIARKRKILKKKSGLDNIVQKAFKTEIGIEGGEGEESVENEIERLEKRLSLLRGKTEEDELDEEEELESKTIEFITETTIIREYSVTLEDEDLKELKEDYDGDIAAWLEDNLYFWEWDSESEGDIEVTDWCEV